MKHARRGNHRKKNTGRNVAIAVILAVIVAVSAAVGLAAYCPQALPQLGSGGTVPASDAGASTGADATAANADASAAAQAPAAGNVGASSSAQGEPPETGPATKRIATYGDVKIYSPIAQKDITGVLFHQASYDTALVMTTELPEANVEKASTKHPVRVNNDQVEGEWVDADALHLYRTTDATAMDTSLDVGAKAGTAIYAPVTGTVVLVKKYDLYGYVPDVEIHIQPDGHPELDLVMLHQKGVQVEKGDHVEAGVTRLSKVRDIAKDLTDIQLSFFTAGDDPGNHSHIQMNNADAPGYRKANLKGAYKVE